MDVDGRVRKIRKFHFYKILQQKRMVFHQLNVCRYPLVWLGSVLLYINPSGLFIAKSNITMVNLWVTF